MMTLQQLVEASPAQFSGSVREDAAALQQLESTLGVSLPTDVRWFWLHSGSGFTDAAPNARRSIADTLRFRSAASLPAHYVVLDDRNDGGAVLLDTSNEDGAVIWVDYYAIERVALGTLSPAQHDYFPTFRAWVSFCIQEAGDAA